MSTVVETTADIVPRLEAAAEKVQRAHKTAATVIFGQDVVIERTILTILSGGHALLIGVPGLAKTLLVDTLGKVLGLEAKRIQFTPDLMPSDIIGSEVLEDEPGKARAFRVLATQNPLEQEGTYPLPEAQLDRFLLQIDVDYPDLIAERRMLYATTGTDSAKIEPVLSAQELMSIQRLVRQIPVPDKVVDAILKLVRSCRPGTGANSETDKYVAFGPGPRASQGMMLAVRAKALIDGRLAPSVDDVIALAEPILKHRMALSFAARAEGQDLSKIIARLAEAVE